MDYINLQFEVYVETEKDVERSQPLSRLEDPRVDVCLYFLSPHTITPLDIEVIGGLSKLVPVVPLMAKVRITLSASLVIHGSTVG